MGIILSSERSSQATQAPLYTVVVVTDRHLVDTISTYRTTLQATDTLINTVVSTTPCPQGILYLVIPVHFMLQVIISPQLILKYFTRQLLKKATPRNFRHSADTVNSKDLF